jgi:hypothetical protein
MNHDNCLECAETNPKNPELSLLERMNLKDTKEINFKVRKHKVIKEWENLAESGQVVRII